MDEKDVWFEDLVLDNSARFTVDKVWLKFNSDDTRERLRIVRYPDTAKDRVQMFYNKIKLDALVEWNDGTTEHSYKEVEHYENVMLLSDVYAKYFGDGDSEYALINTIEDLYEF